MHPAASSRRAAAKQTLTEAYSCAPCDALQRTSAACSSAAVGHGGADAHPASSSRGMSAMDWCLFLIVILLGADE